MGAAGDFAMSVPMRVPMLDLRPMLAETEALWRGLLARLFERMQFVLGEQVAAFEREVAAAWGARFAVGVASGTAAIELGLRASGLGASGAEVIVPALTSLFTAQAVLAAGCRLRFADVDPVHLLLDPASAEAQCGRRTRAIVPVHLYGQPCDMGAVGAVARSRHLTIVQDACQAHGARDGRALTRLSPTVAYSFYPTKNLPCLGDGGAVLTDSARVASELRRLRDGGRNNDQIARVPALNARLDEMQACYLRAFLTRLGEWNTRRERLARLYDEALAGCEAVAPVARREGSVCHLYVVRARRREKLRASLARHGIMTGVHYPVPLHLQPAFRSKGSRRGDFPVAERACREVLSLPLWPHMGEGMVEEVARRVREG
jgi:dTDP-4-amino-4,6-dideoxygalactose transaminase